MILRHFTTHATKRIAMVMLTVMCIQLFCPQHAHALTSGPVQPEAQGFEPVGTTDMVDPFTGDFNYNIPLMDVEGYPVNISYHGGVGMEQEASWVGLGWSLNPGAVNRAVRGLPDEFDGDTVEKVENVKEDRTVRVGLGVGAEALGIGEPYIKLGGDLGGYLTINNYRGVSVDFTASAGINLNLPFATLGFNTGAAIGSQTGASINYAANLNVSASKVINDGLSAGGGFNLNTSGTYSPRTAFKHNIGAGISLNLSSRTENVSGSFSTGADVPIGLENYTAAITTAAYMNTYSGQIKIGGELSGAYLDGKIVGSLAKTTFDQDGSRKGYGFFNLHHSNDSSLLDFSREKDGNWNPTMAMLPQSHITYDVYNVSGQGTGGSFRPFRNDIGSIFDPVAKSTTNTANINIEAGIGDLFEAGGDAKVTDGSAESGPWSPFKRPFTGPQNGIYEDVYFKEAGELTQNDETYLNGIGGTDITTPDEAANIPLVKPESQSRRVIRANHIYAVTGSTLDTSMILDSKKLVSYDNPGFKTYPTVAKTTYSRVDDGYNELKHRAKQITEIIQTQKDGRRYVYGLPVLNNVQREATFAINSSNVTQSVLNSYLVPYTPGNEDEPTNSYGRDNYYSSVVTPSYTSAHLLTAVLSSDYSDVTGDGVTDDDLGTYTKFNYSRKSGDYRWRSPYASGTAQYIPGFKTDTRDDKGSYMIGSREEWMLHSIETKNYVAEFYVSPRQDARGVLDKILSTDSLSHYKDTRFSDTGSHADAISYKLDSIVLYNKHDRFNNGAAAQPIKTVLFTYNYSLCKNVPNTSATDTSDNGKLTLLKIQIRYGNSNINMSAAYGFSYMNNYPYDAGAKDRWGNYMPSPGTGSNYEFPFTNQTGSANDYAKAWSLGNITLPSGGVIQVDYEADDYAYVQNKEAMQMFHLSGVGFSPTYINSNKMYASGSTPALYFYFNRQTTSENSLLSFKKNYFDTDDPCYYNVSVELVPGKFEPIKGYAIVDSIGACSDGVHGFIRMQPQQLKGTDDDASPVVFTALNVGRYNLPEVLFPGADSTESGIANIVAGLAESIGELFHIAENPLEYYMGQNKAQHADLSKSFIRLNSPGLHKKGGGQRVKSIKFFDNWAAMAGGQQATYGKVYDYTIARDDKSGYISSGVASWEPSLGGDELPQHLPERYTVQDGNKFPPNDAIDLYQELPVGESFYPAPVVGYSRVTVRSINQDKGRSSQSEDISSFYTAKDFPIKATAGHLTNTNDQHLSFTNVSFVRTSRQGFNIVLNDMHGKPSSTAHYVLKPNTASLDSELVNAQQNIYLTDGAGHLSNDVRSFNYDPVAGSITVGTHKMGIENDITLDSRMRNESTSCSDFSLDVNGFIVFIPIAIPWGYPFSFATVNTFSEATVTKVTQQYGILDSVITVNQGANTVLHNEVFDAQTGNALVTSVNNEYGDRQYSASYPAYWAYKEMGPAYENQNIWDQFTNPIIIDSLATYAPRFVNYNSAYSSHYDLPSNIIVGRTIVDNDVNKYKLGDELLLYPQGLQQTPVRVWVMGYSADADHCYAILATRQPYETEGVWHLGQTLSAGITYRVARSGNRNRLGETIQSFTTTDRSNVFPGLKNNLTNLISLSAQRYNHNLDQVYAKNMVTDSLNPFVTGKVGQYRPEQSIINLKKRDYDGSTTRTAGTFSSTSYWPTETDTYPAYCMDSTITGDFVACDASVYRIKVTYAAPNSIHVDVWPHSTMYCTASDLTLDNHTLGSSYLDNYSGSGPHYSFTYSDPDFFSNPGNHLGWIYNNGCCKSYFRIDWNGTTNPNSLSISRSYYAAPGGTAPVTFTNGDYIDPGNLIFVNPGGTSGSTITGPHYVSRKIELGKVGHYDGTDNENWVRTSQVTKYNWYGQELENKEEGLGYNSAVYGYNQQLPVCVAKNARHGEVLFEGFEDNALLNAVPSMREEYMRLVYSPFAPFLFAANALGTSYSTATLTATNSMPFVVTKSDAHTGNYCLKTTGELYLPLNGQGTGMADGYSFKMNGSQKYVASLWLKPATAPGGTFTAAGYSGVAAIVMDTTLTGTLPTAVQQIVPLIAASNIIDGWQKYEVTFDVPAGYKNFTLHLGNDAYYDDIRIFPFASNSKGFVYQPVTRKLMATLDENNFATFYEYDAEGNLIRTKKETDQGILTISETRSTHRKVH